MTIFIVAKLFFLLTAESAEGAEPERNIEDKREMLKKMRFL